jgi:hypothetical protein
VALKVYLHGRVAATDIQEDSSNEQTQESCDTNASSESTRITVQIHRFSTTEHAELCHHIRRLVVPDKITSFDRAPRNSDTERILSIFRLKDVADGTFVFGKETRLVQFVRFNRLSDILYRQET